MEESLRILTEQLENLKEDYYGLTECCNNILEFSNYVSSPERDIHNKPLAKNVNNKLKKLHKQMLGLKSKIAKL